MLQGRMRTLAGVVASPAITGTNAPGVDAETGCKTDYDRML